MNIIEAKMPKNAPELLLLNKSFQSIRINQNIIISTKMIVLMVLNFNALKPLQLSPILLLSSL